MRIKLYTYFPTRSENTSSSSVMAACSSIYLVASKQKAGFEFHITAGILSLLTYVWNESRISAARRTLLYGVVGASVVEGRELELSVAQSTVGSQLLCLV